MWFRDNRFRLVVRTYMVCCWWCSIYMKNINARNGSIAIKRTPKSCLTITNNHRKFLLAMTLGLFRKWEKIRQRRAKRCNCDNASKFRFSKTSWGQRLFRFRFLSFFGMYPLLSIIILAKRETYGVNYCGSTNGITHTHSFAVPEPQSQMNSLIWFDLVFAVLYVNQCDFWVTSLMR